MANPAEQPVALVCYGSFLNLPVFPYQSSWHSAAGEFALCFLHKEETLQYFLHALLLIYLLCMAVPCNLIKGTEILALKVPVGYTRVLYYHSTHSSFFSWKLKLVTFSAFVFFHPLCFNTPTCLPFPRCYSFFSLTHLPFWITDLWFAENSKLYLTVPWEELLLETSHIHISLVSPGFLFWWPA